MTEFGLFPRQPRQHGTTSGSARRAGGIGDLRPKRLAALNAGKAHACEVRVTPRFLWHLSVPVNATGAAYADAVARVVAECEEDRLRPRGVATQERAQEVRAVAMLRQQAAVRCGNSPQARGCGLVAAPEQPTAGSCHVRVPEWDWRPGVSLRLSLPSTRPLQSIQLASLPTGLFASFQTLVEVHQQTPHDLRGGEGPFEVPRTVLGWLEGEYRRRSFGGRAADR